MTGAAPPLVRHAFRAFGGSACEVLSRDGSDADVSAAVAEVYAFERQLTRFDPASELSHFNARAGERVEVSPLLEALLRAALAAHALTGGLVNAAVLPALAAAGYDRSIEVLRRETGAGAAASRARRAPGAGPVPPLPAVLEVGEGWARLAPGCGIDLGGVGKGWLADRLAERFEDACVNLGGDLRAVGPGPGGGGWDVRLCDGRVLRLEGAGAATSGTSERSWPGGHHLIDPRTGRPVDRGARAVSVVAADAATAETLAKAAILVGEEAAAGWMRGRGALAWAATW